MTTSLRDWVAGGLKTLHTSSSDFTTSFDNVVSNDVTITINDKTWTRKTLKEEVEKLGKLNAEVTIRDIADASLLSAFVRPSSNHSWDVVVVNYEVIA
ncbi:hypothetical protein EWM64_g7817 [Hericium alpestre]|uniref:Uncharacterized protein n=1 Tax=Hericium alpestre TaxID=135208 RepID=A0A4Y9ZMW5_9AGAM|nr:hypothetical protein EWM64_g7817 [Hericium alpestre]